MATDDDHLETLRLIADTNYDRLLTQRDAIERMETKGTILLGFIAAATQFVLVTNMQGGWKAGALALYVGAFLVALIVVVPYRHAFPPNPKMFWIKYRPRPLKEALDVLAATRAFAFEANVPIANRKRRAWWRALTLAFLAVTLSGMGLVSRSTNNGEPTGPTTTTTIQ